MPLAASILSNTRLCPYSLRFYSGRLEAHFHRNQYPRLLKNIRLALLLGALVYEVYGVLDFLLVPKTLLNEVALIRISSTAMILTVYGISFLKLFKKYHQPLLTLLLAVAASGLLLKMLIVDTRILPYYFSGLMLLVFWIHAFSIHRFLNVLKSTLIIVVFSTVGISLLNNLGYEEKLGYLFIIYSSVAITIFASYVSEKQARVLFLREKTLDRERYNQQQLALHDFLTGLPNRALLLDRVQQAIIESSRHSQLCAGYFIDLDDFKLINDNYSHATGDAVLIEVARRLKGELRAIDTIARISGDEFFVLARDIKSEAQALVLGQKLLASIDEPYILNNTRLNQPISASIGVCMFPYQDVTPIDVLDRADKAMYAIKLNQKSGIGFA